jgi:hypothetical protein
MHSDEVSCADCGEDFVREIRYTPLVRQNAMPKRSRSEPLRPSVGISGDTPQRFEPTTIDMDRLGSVYAKAVS